LRHHPVFAPHDCRRQVANAHVDTNSTKRLLDILLRLLAQRGANEVLVEAGARLSGAFAAAGLVDEYQLFIAPKLLGAAARPLLDLPLERLSEAHRLEIVDIRAVGEDFRVIARPAAR